MLVAVFLLASVLGYLVVRDAVDKTVEHQALTVAENVARQVLQTRAAHVQEMAARPGAEVQATPAGTPAQIVTPFHLAASAAGSADADRLYSYRVVSQWNLAPAQGLSDDFLRWAWPQLEKQDKPAPAAPIVWRAVSRMDETNGRRVLRYLAAEPASAQACVNCHNASERLPVVQAVRAASGVAPGHQVALNQLLGALSVTVPLDESVADAEVKQATAILLAILLASFAGLIWFDWRLNQEGRSLRRTELQLARSELEAKGANELLVAKQGVEAAFAELSTYIQAIDQHALVSVTDPSGRILQVNDKFVQISGYSREELLGKDHRVLNSGTHEQAFFGRMWTTIARGLIWRDEICNRNKSGLLYWVDSAIVPMKDTAGNVVRYISVRVDITEQRRHEETLHYQATHDSLTDLPNRVLLLESTARAIARAKRRQQLVVMFFIDLDKFKQINDTLGHGAGDLVLCEMARRLLALVRGGDMVARLGGDEFVVACEGLPREAVESFGQRIHAALGAPVMLSGEQHTLGGSVGVAVYPDHGDDTETLLKRSDIAMYRAKSQVDGGVCVFSPEMQDAINVRVQMEQRLREAFAKRELVLHFQPQVDFQTGTLVSLEALVRWDSPHYGFLMPGRFIGLAEESRLIGELDAFVLDAACRQMQDWHAKGHGWIRTAVNLAATKFSDPNFKTEVRVTMERYGIPAGVLELEVTESLAMRDPDAALELMRELKGLGILLAVDDFGTGYSNLGYLKRFPADRLKVDQSFVRGLLKNPQDRAIVAAVVQLAHNLNMRAIAEGVESEDEAILLYSLGVDEIQGYWMARPMAPEAVEKLFEQPRLLDPAQFLQREALPVVLLVEDDEISLSMMESLLVSFGVRVVTATSAEEATELFHKHVYAMAIVDHGLPGSNGIELLGQVRKLMPQVVRVLVTASSEPQVLRDAINIGGAMHFLAKPLDPQAMRNVVMDACWGTVAQRRGLNAPSS